MNIIKKMFGSIKQTVSYFKSIKSDSDKYKTTIKRFNESSKRRFKLNDEI